MRRHDWPRRLGAVFCNSLSEEPLYGVHDCAMHAMDCADAMIEGSALADQWRGSYTSVLDGLRVLRKRTGLKSFEAWVDTLWPRIPPAMAQRGDWGMVQTDEGPALVVFDGAFLRGPCGALRPRGDCMPDCAWRVG